MSESEIITQDEDGTPLRWRSPAGVMHAAERIKGTGDLRLFKSRTRCGRNVDPAEVWIGKDTLACDKCFAIEHEDRMRHDHDHGHHGHGHDSQAAGH